MNFSLTCIISVHLKGSLVIKASVGATGHGGGVTAGGGGGEGHRELATSLPLYSRGMVLEDDRWGGRHLRGRGQTVWSVRRV